MCILIVCTKMHGKYQGNFIFLFILWLQGCFKIMKIPYSGFCKTFISWLPEEACRWNNYTLVYALFNLCFVEREMHLGFQPTIAFHLKVLHFPPPYSVCRRGIFNCTYYPCPAVCTVYGDRHYYTFDGLEYDFVSDCQVYLVKVRRFFKFLSFLFFFAFLCECVCAPGSQ